MKIKEFFVVLFLIAVKWNKKNFLSFFIYFDIDFLFYFLYLKI